MPHLSPLPWLMGSMIIWATILISSSKMVKQAWLMVPDTEEWFSADSMCWYDIRYFFIFRSSASPI